MDPRSGEIIVSTTPSSENKIGIREDEALSVTTKKRISPIYFSEHLGSYTMTVENPLKNEKGEVLAIAGVYINIHSLSPLLFNATSTDHSGEIYLVTTNGHAIIRDMVLDSDIIQKSITQKPEVIEYVNHEGIPVIGYQELLPNLQVVFVDEHKVSELFAPLKDLNKRIWIVAGALMLLSITFAYFLIDNFIKPISSLTKAAKRISEGHYGARAKVSSSDEIGILSHSFNQMANSLTQSLNDLSVKNALMEAQYNASLYGQLSIDVNGNVLSWNKAFEELWEIPRGTLKKRNTEVLTEYCANKAKEPKDFIKKTNGYFKYKKKHSHDVIEMKNGKVIDRHSIPLLNKKKKVLGRIFISRDITKEVELNKTKNEFVSLATHQLQTPLTGIRWSMENLSKLTKNNKQQKELVREASQSTERVIHLVSDMLNVSRLDSQMIGINSRKTNVSALMEKTVKEARITAKKKAISIDFKPPSSKIEASLDSDLISEVILNLLSNALRFSETKKRVRVDLKKKGETIEISVKDEGIGISKKNQKELFTKFFRTDQANKYNTTGSGLGLYVIKKILDACNGRIRILSTPGKGSTFTITLPLKGPVHIKKGVKVLIHKGITI